MNDLFGLVFRDDRQRAQHDDVMSIVPALPAMQGKLVGPAVVGPVGMALIPGTQSTAALAEQTAGVGRHLLGFSGTLYNLDEVAGNVATPVQSSAQRLLDLVMRSGVSVVTRLRGEFLIAYWDGQEETLYLMNDRFRSQPIFYCQTAQVLVFGSRLKVISSNPWVESLSIDPAAIVDLMAFSCVTTPRTIFQEVKKMPPAHVLSWRKGRLTLTPYWDIDFSHPSGESRETLKRLIRQKFAEALQVRINQDRTHSSIGTFLSGGIDSSTVTGVLTQLTGDRVKAFTIGFAEPGYNELDFAKHAACHFNAMHFTRNVTVEDVHQALPKIVETFDEPFANASAIPTYFCAKLARENGVDVLYAGDGGDELFAGNERYGTQKIFDYYHAVPTWLRKGAIEPLVHGLAGLLPWGLPMLAKKYINRANVPYPDRLTSWGLFNLLPLPELASEPLITRFGKDTNPYAPIAYHYAHAPANTELDRQLYIDLKLIISDNDLVKVTRASEAAGVAVRFPFLDGEFADCAAKVPAGMKMRGHHLRTFFKDTYADLLPLATRKKTKHGFGLPIAMWLRSNHGLLDMMHDLVLSSNSLHRGYFKREALQRLIEEHQKETGSFYGTIVWNIMIIELWHRMIAPNIRFKEAA
jgi:asparagine synthase (glutamine-hydrolysing)